MEETAVVEKPITCTCVGQIMSPSMAGFKGKVVSQRWVEELNMLLLAFENGYTCNAHVCRIVEDSNGE